MPISVRPWLAEQFKSDQRRFIPYAGHIASNVVMTTDSSTMAMLVLHGTPFELTAPSIRNAQRERINTLLRTFADADTTIGIHLVPVRGRAALPAAQGKECLHPPADG